MKISYTIESIKKYVYPVVVLGNFDGVHLGHQKIVNEAIFRAKQNNGTSIVCTYEPNTKVFFKKITEQDLLYTQEQKLRALQDLGIDQCIILPFSDSLSRMTAEEFVRDILVTKIGIKELVIGYDTNFGSDMKGDKKNLENLGKKYGFSVYEVLPLKEGDQIVSSTSLRTKTK